MLGPLRHPGALAEQDHRVLGQIVRRRGHLGIDQGQIAVRRRKGRPGLEPLPVLVQGGQQGGVGGLGLLDPGDQAVQGLQQPGEAAGSELGQHLGGGEDLRLPQIYRPPLAGHIEQAHGVDLIPKELRPHRPVKGGGENVQDAAPQGKLPHALHLLAPGVARRREALGQLGQIVGRPHPQHLGALGQQGAGQGALEQGLHRTHRQGRLPRRQRPQRRKPPVLPLAGDHGGVVKGEVPGGQPPDGLAGKGGQVLSQTVGLGFVGAQQHHRAARLLPDSGGKVGSVDGGQAGHRRRTAPRVESCQQAGEFRYPGEDLGE